jgi:hypothetical protein
MDCTDGILQAFKCDDGVKIDDYFHGEGLERCEVSGGLFCIVGRDSGAGDDYDVSFQTLNGFFDALSHFPTSLKPLTIPNTQLIDGRNFHHHLKLTLNPAESTTSTATR